MSIINSILPVLVIYKQKITDSPSIRGLINYLSITQQTLDILVYDNSPVRQYNNDILENLNIHYIHDINNAGLSKAYNTGASLACKLHKKWILLLDQDTIFPDDFMDKYAEAVLSNQDLRMFAPIMMTNKGSILSPSRYKRKRGYWLKKVKTGIWDIKKYSPINSGLLINLDLFLAAGGYNENVKLDFTDFQFIDRVKNIINTFYVFDMVCIQDFSGFNEDINKLLHRFAFFCSDARHCEKKNLLDRWDYFVIVIRRLLRLTLEHKTLSFFKVFIHHYCYRKN